jgi:hypothetical protein
MLPLLAWLVTMTLVLVGASGSDAVKLEHRDFRNIGVVVAPTANRNIGVVVAPTAQNYQNDSPELEKQIQELKKQIQELQDDFRKHEVMQLS